VDETSQSVHSEDKDRFRGGVDCGGRFKVRLGFGRRRRGKFDERSVGPGK